MSHAQWVRTHAGEAPPALLARVEAILAANPAWSGLPTAEALLRAGESLLVAVLGTGEGEGREVALDLLAADACVTWAFEAAADEPGTLPARAAAAMERITEVAK